ncbi:ORF6N domain-containing protein [Rosenbergiella epipactidis]|uniref:ORF6N domain-containing protein n=1 Tax=Rosenbergiella epipactidis TaxID=1544694 RepID=UPI001F4D9183|nr:ORF6N domain-containing protein [Rosenbergiella epipactidis]
MQPTNGVNTPKKRLTKTESTTQPSNLPVLAHQEQRVVTTETLAYGYGTTAIRIQQNHIRNSKRFIEGKHYYRLTGDELKSFRLSFSESVNKHTTSLILWTERGASHHAKMLETDQAWDFFEKLEDSYFNVREVYGVMLPIIHDPIQLARAWADAMEAKQQAEALSHQQAEYIEQLEELFSEGLTPVQFCKRLNGVNTTKVNGWLENKHWLYDEKPNSTHTHWRVRSAARDKYLTEKSSQVSPSPSLTFTTYQPVLLRTGAVWLYRKYLKEELPMKITWDGTFTHDKYLAEEL